MKNKIAKIIVISVIALIFIIAIVVTLVMFHNAIFTENTLAIVLIIIGVLFIGFSVFATWRLMGK